MPAKKPAARAKKPAAKKHAGEKRPLNAYMLFCQEKRPEHKEENPEIDATDMAIALGEMWKALPDEEKKPYRDAAMRNMKKWNEKHAKK